MFTQLFGKYLVDEGVITSDENRAIHEQMNQTRVKLGTIAVADGLMNQQQVEEINHLQTQKDKRFGDLAIEAGYLTEAQLDDMLSKQGNASMKFYQLLNENKNISMEDIELKVKGFQKSYGFTDNELEAIKNDDYATLMTFFAMVRDKLITDLAGLVMRNLTRFVSGDFYFGRMKRSTDYSYNIIAGQKAFGENAIYLGFAASGDTEGIVELAKGYAKGVTLSGSEEVYDALCEFANLNNGLLSSELSKHDEFSDMNPPQVFLRQQITGTAYVMPIYIKDKQLDMVISTDAQFAPGENEHPLAIAKTESTVNQVEGASKIMIVDDSSLIRKMLRQLLEKNGYAVVGEAVNGEEAVALYDTVKPDLVTMDVTMPVMDGVAALKKIKEAHSDARVIMVTAAGQKDRIMEALKSGAKAFITKPFDEADLLKNLEQELA
ncbi:MAG: response regulator [Lachnospiraceae bacterium]|nr:response regulator [Candidatus Merdinaster equi]